MLRQRFIIRGSADRGSPSQGAVGRSDRGPARCDPPRGSCQGCRWLGRGARSGRPRPGRPDPIPAPSMASSPAPDRGGARQHQIEAMRDAFDRARPSTERARAMSLVEVNDRSVNFKVEGGASFIRSQSPSAVEQAGLPVPSSPKIEIRPGHGTRLRTTCHAEAMTAAAAEETGSDRAESALRAPVGVRFNRARPCGRLAWLGERHRCRWSAVGSVGRPGRIHGPTRSDRHQLSVARVSRPVRATAGERPRLGTKRTLSRSPRRLRLASIAASEVCPAAITRTTCAANAAKVAPAVPAGSGGPSITTSPPAPARSSRTSWPCAGWRAPGSSRPKVCPTPDR